MLLAWSLPPTAVGGVAVTVNQMNPEIHRLPIVSEQAETFINYIYHHAQHQVEQVLQLLRTLPRPLLLI